MVVKLREAFDSEDEEDEWGVGPGDEEDAENGAQEAGWEPPLPEGTEEGMNVDEDDDEMGDVEGDGNDGEDPINVRLVDRGAKPFVVNYPDAQAGAPSSGERMPSGWESYRTQLEGGSGPWTSKLDWEFARWAQLRGPGATALTELLKIDGVCLIVC